MAEIFRLPAVSPTMELGTIVTWRIQEGASFASGDVLVEIGTDKATVEAQIFEDGTLLKHLVGEDDEVPVNAPIAIFGAPGEDAAALEAQARAELAGGGKPSPAEPQSPVAPLPATPDASTRQMPPTREPVAPPTSRTEDPPAALRSWAERPLSTLFLDPPGDVRAGVRPSRVLASPLARRIAADRGVDLATLRGTGPGGRIVRADVEHAPIAPPAPGPVAAAAPTDEVVKLTPMRRTIAKRLLESHQGIPFFFLTVTFDMAGFVALRSRLKRELPDVRVSYNDMLLLAVAKALRAFPQANASWTDKGIVRHGRVDLGFAVALDEGLVTPVVRGADALSLSTLAGQVRDLAGRARGGALAPEEYTGNTFTVSNLGMFGIEHFTAIINPPASAILAVGALEQVPVVVDGQLTVGHRMKATMTCDHRVLDGAVGAHFLQVLRRYVEAPALMLV